jgi:hypothetical protein
MKKKPSKFNSFFQKKANIIIAIAIIILLLIVILSFKSNKTTHVDTGMIDESVPYGSDIYITPTVMPSENNKLSFVHPNHDFSFEYPKSWNLLLTKRNSKEPLYRVVLTDKNDSFNIYFETGGRDYPHYREITEKKVLSGKNVSWTTLYNSNNEAVEAFTSFPDNNFGDKLLGLYIYLPKDHQKEFVKQVEELIASLK